MGRDLTDRWDTIDKMLEFELQISNFEGIAFLNLDIFVMLQTFPYFVRLGCSHFLHNYIWVAMQHYSIQNWQLAVLTLCLVFEPDSSFALLHQKTRKFHLGLLKGFYFGSMLFALECRGDRTRSYPNPHRVERYSWSHWLVFIYIFCYRFFKFVSNSLLYGIQIFLGIGEVGFIMSAHVFFILKIQTEIMLGIFLLLSICSTPLDAVYTNQ